jgi:hypothetical protein
MMLGNTAQLQYLTISTLNVPFAAQTFPLPNLTNPNNVSSAFPNVSLLQRCYQTVAGPAKSIFLRGFPYTIISGGQYKPTDQWNQQYQPFVSFLTNTQNGQWGWYGVQSKATSLISGYIQNTQPPGQFQVLVTSVNPVFLGLAVGSKQKVRFTAINGKSELNGEQVVYVQSPTTVLTKDQFGVIPWSHGGSVSVQTLGFNTFLSIKPIRIMTRKAGKQLFLEVGRRSVRPRT